MTLSDKQQGILKRMAAGTAVALAFLALAAFGPWSERIAGAGLIIRLEVALGTAAFGLLPLLLSIALLARHRFFTPEDIDGSAMTRDSDRALRLQAILQNTLEQTVLALGTWLAWAAVMPASTLAVIPGACILLLVGRLCFALDYGQGAPRRAFGFVLTFYPTVIMLVCVVARASWLALRHVL